MIYAIGRLLPVLLILTPYLASSQESRVSVAGRVVGGDSVGVAYTAEVRAWSLVQETELSSGEIYSGYIVRDGHSVFVDEGGAYELLLEPGSYKLDVRMGARTGEGICAQDSAYKDMEGCIVPDYQTNSDFWFHEQWYGDQDGEGLAWVQQEAEILQVLPDSPISGVDFLVGLGGAVRGRVRGYADVLSTERDWIMGANVLVEQISDLRRHHNSKTIDDPPGVEESRRGAFVSRGLRSGQAYRVLVHDPDGYNETFLDERIITPEPGQILNIGDLNLARMPADPYSTNRSLESAIDIGRWNFDRTPPPLWNSGVAHLARIAPRNKGVTNWFCWQVEPQDRFEVTATTLDTIKGLPGRYHPFMDPYIMVVDAADPTNPVPGTKPDRYSGPGPLDAMVDTGPIAQSATYCAVVTTAGDYGFAGMGQYTSGPYILTIERIEAPHVEPPRFEGVLSEQCSGHVATTSPLELVVSYDPADYEDDLQFHIQVYPRDGDPDDAPIDVYFPADSGVTTASIELDIRGLSDNTQYSIRARSYRGEYYSDFVECDFWTNIRNSSPTKLEILEPEPGTILPLNTEEVVIIVQNAYDPDLVVPGTTLEIIWCSSLDSQFGNCPPSLMDWNRTPLSSYNTEETTEFVVDGITNREAWYIRVCAIDETGLCGPHDDTWVLAEGEKDSHGSVSWCSSAPVGSSLPSVLFLLGLLMMGYFLPRQSIRVQRFGVHSVE